MSHQRWGQKTFTRMTSSYYPSDDPASGLMDWWPFDHLVVANPTRLGISLKQPIWGFLKMVDSAKTMGRIPIWSNRFLWSNQWLPRWGPLCSGMETGGASWQRLFFVQSLDSSAELNHSWWILGPPKLTKANHSWAGVSPKKKLSKSSMFWCLIPVCPLKKSPCAIEDIIQIGGRGSGRK